MSPAPPGPLDLSLESDFPSSTGSSDFTDEDIDAYLSSLSEPSTPAPPQAEPALPRVPRTPPMPLDPPPLPNAPRASNRSFNSLLDLEKLQVIPLPPGSKAVVSRVPPRILESHPEDGTARYAVLPFMLPSEIPANKDIRWLWEAFIARGELSLLTSGPKHGKTTLICTLLRLMESGGFFRTPVSPCRVLLVTEESEGFWYRRTRTLHLGNNVALLSRPVNQPITGDMLTRRGSGWEDFCVSLACTVRACQFDLVILDPWIELNPSASENDNMANFEAIKAINHITDTGAAVLLTHHARKAYAGPSGYSSGGMIEAPRGAGALTGYPSFLLYLACPPHKGPGDTTERILRLDGRAQECCDHRTVTLDFNVKTQLYSVSGGSPSENQSRRMADILLTMSRHSEKAALRPAEGDGTDPYRGMTSVMLQDIINSRPQGPRIASTNLSKLMVRLENDGFVSHKGRGCRNDPRWYLLTPKGLERSHPPKETEETSGSPEKDEKDEKAGKSEKTRKNPKGKAPEKLPEKAPEKPE